MRVFIEFMPSLGDLVTQLPILHELRARDPDLDVEILLLPAFAPLLDDYDWIGRRHLRDGTLSSRLGPVRSGLTRPFDLLLFLRRNPSIKFNRILVRARRKLGPEAYDPALARENVTLKRFSILRHVFGDLPAPDTRIRLAPERFTSALNRAEVEQGARILCMGPGVSRADRQWPMEQFARLGRRIGGGFDAIRILGSPAEAELCQQVAEGCGGRSLAGIPLTEVAALLAHTTLYVGNNSGLSHLAAAQDCRAFSVALSDPSYGPWQGAGLAGEATDITAEDVARSLREQGMLD
jgi:ADP-heptose:LPS heptosyltransferase